MRRADRLFQLIECLRSATRPLTAEQLAQALETSRWTIYRDIAALIAQRVPVRGEAGIGYVLDRGFHVPPLMLTLDEIEAIALGTQWVAANGDDGLAGAARAVHAKIAAVLPKRLRGAFDAPAVATPPPRRRRDGDAASIDVARLRTWCRQGFKLTLRYVDNDGRESARTVWPFLVGYVGEVRIVAAWCELRTAFRTFRIDRIRDVAFLDTAYPAQRAVLRRRWLALMAAQRT